MAQTPKIMLVEDDINLSEIYQARMAAEGYTIVSAHDGEEALALAAKEKPDLIIADVMMPKISGFEMLDILRNTEGLKNTKVIMLTALGQAEDKTRAQTLGADRYLVKSQVTLEDIVKNARELLGDESTAPTGPVAQTAPAAAAPVAQAPVRPTMPIAAPTQLKPTPAANLTVQQQPVPATPKPTTAVPAQPLATPVNATLVPPPARPAQPAILSAPPASVVGNPQPTVVAPTTPQPAGPPPTPAPAAPTPVAAPMTAPPSDSSAVTAAEPASQENNEVQEQIASFANQPAQAMNTQTLTNAVNELLAATPQPQTPTPPPPIQPTPPVPTAAVATTTLPTPAATSTTPSVSVGNPQPTVVAPTTPQPAGPPPTPAPAAPTVPPVPPTPAAQPAGIVQPQQLPVPATVVQNVSPVDDSAPVAHKKVIRPIGDPVQRPDLNTLLAAEEAKHPAAPAATASAGSNPTIQLTPPAHQPGNVFTPATPAANKNNTGIDPSSIAL